jgi:hypothetical protein
MLDTAIDHLMAAPFSSWRALRYGWRHIPKLRGTVASEMRRLISDERIRAALTGALVVRISPNPEIDAPHLRRRVRVEDDRAYGKAQPLWDSVRD